MEKTKNKKILIAVICLILVIVICVVVIALLNSNKDDKNNVLNENENTVVEEGNSLKIAKLIKGASINNSEEIIKELSEKQIEKIDEILKRADKKDNAIIDYTTSADYMIKFNDEDRNNIDIREHVQEDGTIDMLVLDTRYTIYEENDVNYILEILGKKIDLNISIINLDNYTKPFDLYFKSGVKFEQGTYSWKVQEKGGFTNVVNSDSISAKDMFEGKDSIEFGYNDRIITINSKDEQNLKCLPKEAIVSYKIYGIDEDEVNFEFKEAIRMINGDYYMQSIPEKLGEYIVEVYISFGDFSSNHAFYCMKVKM